MLVFFSFVLTDDRFWLKQRRLIVHGDNWSHWSGTALRLEAVRSSSGTGEHSFNWRPTWGKDPCSRQERHQVQRHQRQLEVRRHQQLQLQESITKLQRTKRISTTLVLYLPLKARKLPIKGDFQT